MLLHIIRIMSINTYSIYLSNLRKLYINMYREVAFMYITGLILWGVWLIIDMFYILN